VAVHTLAFWIVCAVFGAYVLAELATVALFSSDVDRNKGDSLAFLYFRRVFVGVFSPWPSSRLLAERWRHFLVSLAVNCGVAIAALHGDSLSKQDDTPWTVAVACFAGGVVVQCVGLIGFVRLPSDTALTCF
jgi:hypothetical protein